MNLVVNSPRGRRRMEADRMRARAVRFAKSWHLPADHLLKDKNHLASCSCMCCGNARKHLGRDLSELRSIDAMHYDLAEIA